MSSIFDETSYLIVVNENNLVPSTNNNVYEFSFNGTKRFDKNSKIALNSVNMFFSWFNIDTAFNNTEFSFIFTQNDIPTQYDVSITSGYYTIADLNSYLQAFMIDQGLYLVDGSGNYVYYLEITSNSSQYAIQLNTYPFPTALPAGYSNPNGLLFNTVATTPQFIINNDGFATFTGISAGTYPNPAQATTYSKISDTTPRTNPVENVLIRCNLLNNKISNPPDVLYSFNASGTSFGGLITSMPNEYLYIDIQEGYYSTIRLEFVSQDYIAVKLNDPSIVLQLSFKEKRV